MPQQISPEKPGGPLGKPEQFVGEIVAYAGKEMIATHARRTQIIGVNAGFGEYCIC